MGARRRCSEAAHHPSSSFPTWALAQVWVLARGALASRASHDRRSAVKVTLGSLYRLVEAQPHTHLRTWEQNCASERGDENGILDRPSLPLLMVVHLQSWARDQRAQAKGAVVVVVPPAASAALALAYCGRKRSPRLVLANCALHVRGLEGPIGAAPRYQRKVGSSRVTTRQCMMKTRRGGDGLSLVKELRKGMHAREAGQRYRCSIAYKSAVVDLISQSRARVRPHRIRLALVPAAAGAVVACTAAVTVLRVEQEPGSTAQERRYFGGEVDHEGVASVSSDQGLALGDKQKLTATCGCLRCKGGSGAIGWRGIRSVGGSTYSSSSSSAGGGPMLDGFWSG
jgi:hypothetical protein